MGWKWWTKTFFKVLFSRDLWWSDYDGPFDTAREAVQHMAVLCGEYTTPEMLHSAVLTYFSNNMLDLAKDDNGSPINGNQIYWKNTIWKDGEIIWEGNDARSNT